MVGTSVGSEELLRPAPEGNRRVQMIFSSLANVNGMVDLHEHRGQTLA